MSRSEEARTSPPNAGERNTYLSDTGAAEMLEKLY